jgi:hypothetical protein
METICDKDGYIANLWRALQGDPDAVAKFCDYPVNHADLKARRKYLIRNAQLLEKLVDDPDYFDTKMAGYWIWAASCWIGSGLTRPRAMPDVTVAKGVNKQGAIDKRPHLGRGEGVEKISLGGRPQVALQGGVHAMCQIPSLGGEGATGVTKMQIPLLDHETGIYRRPTYGANGAHGVHKVTLFEETAQPLDVRDPYTPGIYDWFRQLSERLRRVRVVCGDWSRICGGDWQDDRGTCGIFFDPPYSKEAGRDPSIYHEESATVAHEVREWCRARADRKTYRIVLAGYFEEHESLLDDGWTVYKWSTNGGFANRGNGKTQGEINRHKEALFFSPHCHSSGLRRFGLEEVTTA